MCVLVFLRMSVPVIIAGMLLQLDFMAIAAIQLMRRASAARQRVKSDQQEAD
jgi:hypothetical protein